MKRIDVAPAHSDHEDGCDPQSVDEVRDDSPEKEVD
jgi:hypothetical protein